MSFAGYKNTCSAHCSFADRRSSRPFEKLRNGSPGFLRTSCISTARARPYYSYTCAHVVSALYLELLTYGCKRKITGKAGGHSAYVYISRNGVPVATPRTSLGTGYAVNTAYSWVLETLFYT